MIPPCSISITNILLQLAVSVVMPAWGLFNLRLLSGAVIYQFFTNSLHRGFYKSSSTIMTFLFPSHTSSGNSSCQHCHMIYLLRFWGDVCWDGSLCCKELSFFAGLFCGPCSLYTACLHHSSVSGLWAGAERSWGHGGFASLWACGSSITSPECLWWQRWRKLKQTVFFNMYLI